VKFSFAGSSFAGKNQYSFFLFSQFIAEGYPICDRQLRSQMRNHPTDVKSSASKMKGTVSAMGKTIRAPLPLPEQLFQRYVPGCKDTKIPVHGKNPLL